MHLVDWFDFGFWEPINTLVQLLSILARSLRLGRSLNFYWPVADDGTLSRC